MSFHAGFPPAWILAMYCALSMKRCIAALPCLPPWLRVASWLHHKLTAASLEWAELKRIFRVKPARSACPSLAGRTGRGLYRHVQWIGRCSLLGPGASGHSPVLSRCHRAALHVRGCAGLFCFFHDLPRSTLSIASHAMIRTGSSTSFPALLLNLLTNDVVPRNVHLAEDILLPTEEAVLGCHGPDRPPHERAV